MGLYGRPQSVAWKRWLIDEQPGCAPRATIKAHPTDVDEMRIEALVPALEKSSETSAYEE